MASTKEKGPFRNLQAYPTFRDALRESSARIKPTDETEEIRPPSTGSPWWLIAVVVLAGLWLTAGVIYWLLK
jgi:hypothetical protein